MKTEPLKVLILGTLLFAGGGPELRAQSASITWFKIANGGGTSTNSASTLSGTFGQAEAGGPLTGGGLSLVGGFWNLSTLFDAGAPVIIQQPSNLSVTVSAATTFSVTAIGASPLSYQWRLDGVNLDSATNSSYFIANTLPADPSQPPPGYDVVVTNSLGSITSQVAVLTVNAPIFIFFQPQSQTVMPGSNATFNVTAIGTPPIRYEWRHNGNPLDGLGSNYTVLGVQFGSAGAYDVILRNVAGSVTSQVAVLTVQDDTQPAIQGLSNFVVQCTGPAGAPVSFGVTVTDLYDPSPTLTCTPPSGSIFPIGFTTVTCVATDSSGNTNIASFTVQVTGQCDAGCIVLTTPSDIQVTLGQASTVRVEFAATATNICSGQPYPVLCTPYPGAAFPAGTNLVTCIASAGGASVTNSFHVVVTVTNPPVLLTPGLITTYGQSTNAQGQAGAVVNYNVKTIDSAGLPVTVTTYPPSGSFFPTGTNIVTVTATDSFGNATVTHVPVVVGPPETHIPGVCDYNWGFEDTQGLGCWTATGTLVYSQPVVRDFITVSEVPALAQQMQSNIGGDYWQKVFYPVGQKGLRWFCTGYIPTSSPAGDTTGSVDDSLTGTLVSGDFVINADNITFLIGGGSDPVNLLVELLVQDPTGTILFGNDSYSRYDWRTGTGSELMRREWFGRLIGNGGLNGVHARIRITDNSTTGHLNVDDFQFQNISPTDQTVTIGCSAYPALVQFQGYYYDWDSPVWGFADMHAHPMSCIGFGQKMFHGQPDGAVLNTNLSPNAPVNGLANCYCDHEGPNFFDFSTFCCSDYYRELFVGLEDPGGNDPHKAGYDADPLAEFNKWPVFSTITHQQMWYDWIRRAYNGGERVMVALCVNNALLAAVSKGDPDAPHDDKTVGDHQIQAMKDFVARHSDFLEIAYDPFQLRDIVRRNKLAIILGSELDDIGNLVQDPNVIPNKVNGRLDPYSQLRVVSEIQWLYDEGLRYMFTVHLADNKFGGSPVSDPLLDVGSKFLNQGTAETAEPAAQSDGINYALPCLDYTSANCLFQQLGVQPNVAANIQTAAANGISILGAVAGGPLELASSFPATPVGSGGGMRGVLGLLAPVVKTDAEGAVLGLEFGLLSAALVPVPLPLPLPQCPLDTAGIRVAATDIGRVMQANLLPAFGNYPPSPTPAEAPYGVRNRKGLSDLGAFAVQEMMKRGMMLDADHMSQHTADAVFNIATNVPGGYPLNSGHNSFRELSLNASENHRSASQLATIQQLGGLMGVGWEDGADGSFTRAFSDIVSNPIYSVSSIPNDCAGTSKTWAQLYLYALEKFHGSNVTFGTDTDGLIQLPGPRFGPQSAYGLDQGNIGLRASQIAAQQNGVLYRSNALLTTAAFWGRAVDPSADLGAATLANGCKYTTEQAYFFAGLNIYYYELPLSAAWSENDAVADESAIQNALSDVYPNSRYPSAFAYGMLAARYGWNICSRSSDNPTDPCGIHRNEVAAQQYLGASVYLSQVGGSPPRAEVTSDHELFRRYLALLEVWSDYQAAFGYSGPEYNNNGFTDPQLLPMIPCQTDAKQWDINFEGVAHYGLIPDFLQDLNNVGLQPTDLSVIFRSAEGFAQMWTKCLQASCEFTPQFYGAIQPDGLGNLTVSFTHGDTDVVVEENNDLQNPLGWAPAAVSALQTNVVTSTVSLPLDTCTNCSRFFRLRALP